MMAFAGWGYPGSAFDARGKPALWEFIRTRLGLTPDQPTPAVDVAAVAVPPGAAGEGLLADLRAAVGAEHLATDNATRLLHGFGKSYRDLLRARRGEPGRLPDAVVFPGADEDVARVLAAAARHGAKVVPFGGGTNIVGAVEPSPRWPGPVVTLNLRRLNRLVALDETAQVATLEAGALGPELEAALNARGYTLGHFPDSFEYSTLGGWLATRSAGMQSDARGKIEDMVVALRLVTPAGVVETRPVPRAAVGPDLNQLAVGSEGIFGVITRAVMRVYPLQAREYRGVLMPSLEAGLEFMRQCAQSGGAPATLRLSNPEETKLGFALKTPGGAASRLLARAVKVWLERGRGFDFNRVCLLIVGWEGTPEEIARRREATLAQVRAFGGFDAGKGAGDAWFARKYEYPLLRDLVMDIGGMVDVTEATVLWSSALATYRKVEAGLRAALARGEFPGYVGCHLSHAYPAGVCLYFTFGAARAAGREIEQYLAVKKLAVDLLIESGASLSHHHAVGYEHLPWVEGYLGPAALGALRAAKAALDPAGVCNPGKLLPGPESALDQYWPGWTPRPPSPP